jgi:GxxExxY protein
MNSFENMNVVEETYVGYSTIKFPLQQETFKIIGACMEVHNQFGRGFTEVVYKDALEHEFQLQNISFSREQCYQINYKDIVLQHSYRADFVVFDKIILEIKATKDVIDSHFKQTINYLAASKNPIGLIINFGEDKLTFKRVIL